MKLKENIGFSFITIADDMTNLPNRSEQFILISEKNSCIISKELNSESQTPFVNEYVNHLST